MPTYKICKLSISKYFENNRSRITAIPNWWDKSDEIVRSAQALAPNIPYLVLSKCFVRVKKNWTGINEAAFANNFEIVD